MEDAAHFELLGSPAPTTSAPSVSASPILPTGGGVGEPTGMMGGYDGASRMDRSIALWAPPLRSADLDILPDKDLADARARDMDRNDAYILGGRRIHQDSIVGAQFALNAKPNIVALGLDETFAEEFQKEVEAKFDLWAESTENYVDASRMNTLTGLVRLAVGVFSITAEVLASAEWIKDGRSINTAIQMIDTDRLSNPNMLADTFTLRAGVERDRFGAPIAYHIRSGHPADINDPNSYFWKRVPARKPWGRVQIIHIVEQMRPAQTRGISDMVSALKEIYVTRKFRDIVLQNAVVNATYAASIESDLPSAEVFAQLGGGDMNVSKAITDYAGAYLSAVAAYSGSAKNLHLDGVKIPHLFPGTKFKLQNAGTPGGVGTNFEESLLRYIAASLGVSYEQLSRDYTKTNYSSARASMNETWKYMQARKKLVADRFASMIYRLWLEEMINKGEITSLPRRAPNWYEGQNADAYSQCDWIGASKGQVDELKETQAAVLRVQNNFSTIEDETARLGKDWRKVIAQRDRERRELKARDLLPPEPAVAQQGGDNNQDQQASAQTEDASELL